MIVSEKDIRQVISQKDFTEKFVEALKKHGWMHYCIRDRLEVSCNGHPKGTEIVVPRCDKYSEYAYAEKALFIQDVEKIFTKLVKETLETST